MCFSSRYRSRHKCDHKGPKGKNRKTTPMPPNQFQDVLGKYTFINIFYIYTISYYVLFLL